MRISLKLTLSRVSVRGVLTNIHNKIARTEVEAPNSTLYTFTRTIVDGRDLEDGKGVERIDQGSRPATVEYENRPE